MHEFSIALNIIDIVIEQAVKNNAKKINEIEIEVGDLSGIVLEALKTALDAAIKNSIIENSKITIIELQAIAYCKKCKKEFYTKEIYSCCPECNSFEFEIKQGKDVRVKSIRIE